MAKKTLTARGRRINKRTFALQKGTAIVRTIDDPDFPEDQEVRLTIQIECDVSGVDLSFNADRTADEATVLKYDGDTFRILNIVVKEPDPELPGITGEGNGDGTAAAEDTAKEPAKG